MSCPFPRVISIDLSYRAVDMVQVSVNVDGTKVTQLEGARIPAHDLF